MDRALEQQAGTLQRCFPSSDGGASVAVSLKVTDDGGVARVDGEPADALARCIEAEVILWALPPARPGEVSRVVREFVFAPGVIAVRPFASTRGGLDKDVIMKVTKANQSQIRFCYEVVLQEKRSLAGKVAVAWTIAPDGSVQSATVTDDTMGDPRVAECVVARVLRWTFPEPVGGGSVNVTFPWLFKTAGNP
jgi:TonB family protein